MSAPPTSRLDADQCIQGSYEDSDGALRVNVNAPLTVNGDLVVAISEADNDSVLVYGTQDGSPSGTHQVLKVNSDGSIDVNTTGADVVTVNQGTSPWVVLGTVTSNIGTTGGLALDTTLKNNTQTTQIVDADGTSADIQPIANPLTGTENGIVSNSVIYGHTTAGGGAYVEVKVTPSGAMNIDGTVSASQSGTWNINNITGTVSLPTGAATETTLSNINSNQTNKTQFTKITDGTDTALVTGAGELNVLATAQPGVDIGDVTINNTSGAGAVNIQDGGNSITVDGTVAATQSGTWTVQQGTPPWSVVGNVASAATDSGNPLKTGAIFNTTLPTVTNGQRVDSQADANGRHIVASVPLDGSKATYSAAITGLVVATTPTDIFTITGSGTKTVRVLLIQFSGIQNTAAVRDVLLIKRSTANTGGTSTNPTAVSHDSNNAAATATINAYTVNPTLGTTVGTVRSTKFDIVSSNLSSASNFLTWDFGNRPGQAIVLRGTTQVLAVNLNAITSATNSMNIYVEWVEE